MTPAPKTCLVVALLSICGYAGSAAANEAPAAATWKFHTIQYTHGDPDMSWSCEALERTITGILVAVGAHPKTRVQAGCGQVARRGTNVFIYTATPSLESAPSPPEKTEQRAREEMGLDSTETSAPLTAARRTLNLSQDRQLALNQTHCHLMNELRRMVLPKLGVEVHEHQQACMSNSERTPLRSFSVSALIPAGSSE